MKKKFKYSSKNRNPKITGGSRELAEATEKRDGEVRETKKKNQCSLGTDECIPKTLFMSYIPIIHNSSSLISWKLGAHL